MDLCLEKIINKITDKHRIVLICLVLAVVTLAAFWQVKDHDFINFDDNIYVTNNPDIQTGLSTKSASWAFTAYHAGNWHPLTWLSHMLDVELFKLNPGWHHLTNLFFHIANTLLLFLVLHRMTRGFWQSAFVAAVFALHPLHVESVAWVAERKDVLSTFFWLLTMGAYVFYVERPELKRYLLALLFFALGLMAKPMLVTLPFVLLLLDYWPLGRLEIEKPLLCEYRKSEKTDPPHVKKLNPKRKGSKSEDPRKTEKQNFQQPAYLQLVWEKIPFFVLSLASSIITYMAQQKGGAVGTYQSFPLSARIGNALVSYFSYIEKMVWPKDLAVLYPHPGMLPPWQVLGAALFLVLTTFLILWTVRRVPYLTVGWLWYLGTLVPVIGIVQVGVQSMADRYTYVPLIGLFIMIAWGVPDLLKKWPYQRVALGIVSVVILSLLTASTWMQVRYWANSAILYSHALGVTSSNYKVHNNFGNILKEQGKLAEAISHYSEALRINPNYSYAHNNLGLALQDQGKLAEAISHYSAALRINAQYAEAYSNLGTALREQGRFQEAIYYFTEAVLLKPELLKPYINLGETLAAQGKYGEAAEFYARALRINPELVEVHYNLGTILFSQRNTDEAIAHFREAVRLKPDYAKAYNNLGNALLVQGKVDEAVDNFQQALRLKPDYALERGNLRVALILQKKSR